MINKNKKLNKFDELQYIEYKNKALGNFFISLLMFGLSLLFATSILTLGDYRLNITLSIWCLFTANIYMILSNNNTNKYEELKK